MGNPKNLRGFYKYTTFVFFEGIGGSVWGGMTIYYGIPVVFLTYLNASSMQIGLITAIFWGMLAIPQFWAAYISEMLTIKKNWVALVIFVSSFTWLILGLYVYSTKASNTHTAIWLFLILYTCACFIKCFDVPANSAMVFKLIPTEKLGRLGGIAAAVGTLGLVSSGFVNTKINMSFAEPMNFSVFFLATFVISVFTALIIYSIDEPESEKIDRAPHFAAFLKKVVTIIKTDTVFDKFIIGKWLMSGNHILTAFILAFLIKERGVSQVVAGWFPSMMAVGNIICGLTIARINDFYGPRIVFFISQFLVIIYMFFAWLSPWTGTPVIIMVFIISGIAMAADWSGFGYMTYQCCPTEDKSTYVAITFLGINVFTVPLPIIFGKLMDTGILNYNKMFTIFMISTIVSIIYLFTVFKHPQAFYDIINERKAKAAAVQEH